jgi:hypothetical protein
MLRRDNFHRTDRILQSIDREAEKQALQRLRKKEENQVEGKKKIA